MVAPGRYDFRRHVYGRPASPPPIFPEPLDEADHNALVLLSECELPDHGHEERLVCFHRQAKLGQALKDLAELALALVGVGAVVLGLWLAKAWE